jgi:hypothetical protein
LQHGFHSLRLGCPPLRYAGTGSEAVECSTICLGEIKPHREVLQRFVVSYYDQCT